MEKSKNQTFPHEDFLREEEIISEIHSSLKKLEDVTPLFVPSLQTIQLRVKEHEKKRKKELYQDLMIFSIVILLTMLTGIFLFTSHPSIMLVLQVAVVVIIPFVLLKELRQKVADDDE